MPVSSSRTLVFRQLAIGTGLLLLSSAAVAQNVITQNTTIRTSLCVGIDCLDTENYGADTLRLKAANASIHIEDTSNPFFPNNEWRMVFNDNESVATGGLSYFGIDDITAGTAPFRLFANAPDASLVVDGVGVGVGAELPLASLHVYRDDGTAQLLVEESVANVAPRTLFKLSNPGNTKFEIDNTDAMTSWAFTNSGSDFRVSLQDSGVVEFRVDNNGDAFLAGILSQNSDREAKTGINAVDPNAILEKVMGLPIAEWAYKETPESRHIGPMAQDFHAAFGTGSSDRQLATLDVSGVAIASIQALNGKLEGQLRDLQAQNQTLAARNAALEERLALIEAWMASQDPQTAMK